MTLVDTSVWIDYFRGSDTAEADWLDRMLSKEPLASMDLIVCECLRGAASDSEADGIKDAFANFHVFETGLDLAQRAAANSRILRKTGHTIRSTIDCLIATLCIEAGLDLLHRDRDFTPFEQHLDLRVVHP